MDSKKQQILRNALVVVTRYGFRRSSMDDFAQAAGMSRPALYQHFRNKEDLFTSCVDMLIEDSFSIAEAALAGAADDTKAQVTAFLTAYMVFYYRLVVAGPHGAELFDVNAKLGAEKTQATRNRFIARLNAIIGLDAEDNTGAVLSQASEGLKFRAENEKMLVARIGFLVDRFDLRAS